MAGKTTDRVLLAAVLVLVGTLGWILRGVFELPTVVEGDTAPQFQVAADGGRTVSRGSFGGKVMMLNFWASWCAPCVQEIPSLNALQRQYAERGLVVVAVSVDKDEKAYREFLQKRPVTFVTARDPDAKISWEYGTFKYPETYLIDSSGKVLEKFIGARDWMSEEMQIRIRRHL